MAEEHAPSIVFIDFVDAIGPSQNVVVGLTSPT